MVYPLRMSNPAEKPEIFMPQGYDPRAAVACRSCLAGIPIGRLKPGIEVTQAQAELSAITTQITREYPTDFARGTSVELERLRDHLIGPIQTALWVLLGAVAFVLLIACVNIANLLLARATARGKEIAIRSALGAGRGRLAGQLLTESLLLSVAGGIAGVLLGWWGTLALATLAPKELPRMDEVGMDASVLLFGLGLSILTGLLFGMLPALRASRFDAVRSHARGGVRNILVIAEVALAFVLAVGTGLLTKSLLRLTSVNSGFDPHHIFTLTLTLDGAPYRTPEATRGYYRRVVEKVRAVPGILSAGMVSNVPLSRTEPANLRVEGRSEPERFGRTQRRRLLGFAGLLSRLQDSAQARTILQRSRRRRSASRRDHQRIACKSRFQGLIPSAGAFNSGHRKHNEPWSTIVGIVGDVRNVGLDQEPDEAVYVPQTMDLAHYTRLVVRTAGEPMSFNKAVRAAILED